jgi:branched-chain amino acid transport system substrate-binding protein
MNPIRKSLGVATMLALAVSAQAAETIKLGVTEPMTGPAADFGIDAYRGMQMAVDEINGRGGIKGQKLELVLRDDEGEPSKAQTFAKELVYKDDVVAFWPSTLTTSDLATLGVTAAAGVPHIVAGTTSDVICPDVSAGRPCASNVFRYPVLNSWQAQKLVDFASKELKAKRIAVLYDSTEYGQDGFRLLQTVMKKAGLTPVYTATFDLGEKNFEPYLTAIQQAHADAIVSWSLGFVVARIAIEKKQLGMDKVTLLGSEAIVAADYRKLGGDAANGTYISTRSKSLLSDTQAQTQAFVARYIARFHSDPVYAVPPWTVTYYDSVNQLAKVIEKVGPDRKKIIEGLASFGPYTGVTGVVYTFNKGNHNGVTKDSVAITVIKDGKQTDVSNSQ